MSLKTSFFRKMQKPNGFYSFNLVRFNPFFNLGGTAGQIGYIGCRVAFVVVYQTEVDVTRELLASISGLVE